MLGRRLRAGIEVVAGGLICLILRDYERGGETKPLHREREREACVKHREGRMEGGLSTAQKKKVLGLLENSEI
jgi:hypothetical protein